MYCFLSLYMQVIIACAFECHRKTFGDLRTGSEARDGIFLSFFMGQKQQKLHFLAIGDSLTAGYFNRGRSYHPYANYLSTLFSSIDVSIDINQQGVSGERVLPTMVQRLETLLFKTKHPDYDGIIILGGTNDIGCGSPAERIFNEGLKPMYDMVIHYRKRKTKLIVMTIIENGYFSPEDDQDKDRQQLNEMIRDYVISSKDQERVYLVDLDKGIPYHNMNDLNEREIIWDDKIHLKPNGYDRMALLIFEIIKNK